jgi:FAD-dependent urate hydroxylase
MSSSELTGAEPTGPDIHLLGNGLSGAMMPGGNLSRVSSDVLVLDGSTRQALVVTRALGRRGLLVMGAESADLCDPRFGAPTFASRWSTTHHVLPSYHDDPTSYARDLLALVSAQRTRVVIPSMDGSIAALRPWRSSFEREGVAVAIASEAAFEVANDKQRTLRVAEELGVSYPRTVPIDRIEDTAAALAEVGLPAVIKPVRSWVSTTDLSTRVISEAVLKKSEALAYMATLQEVGGSAVAQQWVTGPREAVSVFYAKGTVWAMFAQVAHRTAPALGGVSVVRESIPVPADLEVAALALVGALDLEGYSEVEFRRDATGRPLLMEINARLSGSLEVAVRSGVAFPELLWRWAADEPLFRVPGFRTGVKMRYLGGDVKWLWENLECRGRRPDCVTPKKALATFARGFLHRQSYDCVDRTDMSPAFVALAGEVRRAKRKVVKSQPGRTPRRPDPTPTRLGTTISTSDVGVIGAGPNGLSVGAHLRHAGLEHRVFGRTMGAWRFNMPAGMILKSEPYASDLSAPGPGFLARDYCAEAQEVYHERVIPLSREQFISYGTWFADHLVPEVEDTEIVSLSQAPRGEFMLRTANDERIKAARVVVSTGIMPFAFVPPELSGLPSELVSHTTDHSSLDGFRGKDVLVLGLGSSALETAALLQERGATVKLVARGEGVSWPTPNPANPSRVERLRKPVVRLCEGWPCWVYDRLPDLFRFLPKESRVEHGLGFLGPQGAWWLRERVEDKIPMLLGHQLIGAEQDGERVRLHLRSRAGDVTESADHVVAGTGFRLDVNRLEYIAPALRADLKLVAGAPVLDRHLESTVPGLYFTGALAAPSLGPLMRFVAGTHFTGPRIVDRLCANKA